MNIFWETITHYNAGTWIYQAYYHPYRLMVYLFLFHHPTPAKKKEHETISYIFQCMGSRRVLS